MRTAYLDDSAKEPDQGPGFVLAGWVATASVWTDFEAAWKAVLKKYNAPPFHHTDLRARKKGFESFDDAAGDTLLSELVGVIETHELDGYVVTVHHASFKKMWNGLQLTKEQFKRLFNRAFSYCFHAMMQTILQDSVARGIREPINVILDGEDREVVEAVAMLDKEIRPDLPAEQKRLLGTVGTILGTVGTKGGQQIGIQAADLLASRLAIELREGSCTLCERMRAARRVAQSPVTGKEMQPYMDVLEELRQTLSERR
jgi:hypothetical protein